MEQKYPSRFCSTASHHSSVQTGKFMTQTKSPPPHIPAPRPLQMALVPLVCVGFSWTASCETLFKSLVKTMLNYKLTKKKKQ